MASPHPECGRREIGIDSHIDFPLNAVVHGRQALLHLRPKHIPRVPSLRVRSYPDRRKPRYGDQEATFLQIVWIVLGLLVGFMFSKVTNFSDDDDFLIDIVIGVAGAMSGGWLYGVAVEPDATSASVYSLAAAIVAASIFLVFFHAVVSRTR